jgi:formate dehydrogenase major subunit
MGSNMAECHPVGFQWVTEAKQRGAKVYHVDPRFSRTSALVDRYLPLRAGSDIAFLGGVINYILSRGREFTEYVRAYTNVAQIISEDVRLPDDLDGVFSGYDPDRGAYDQASWQYEGLDVDVVAAAGKKGRQAVGGADEDVREEAGGEEFEGASIDANLTRTPQDPTLQHPRCVFQLLKRHYARYTPELVADACGISEEAFLELCETLCDNSGPERTSTFVYSVGWTQHTVGVQYIKAATIVQLLLGNVGRPGGGILALRGHASIQGSTDIPTLYDLLPGYLPMPHAGPHPDLDTYERANKSFKGFWANTRAYLVSLLKAWWGDAATADNDYCYDHLPRLTGDHSTYQTTLDMLDGEVAGFFLWGQNPAVGSAHSRLHRLAMAKLDWLVVRDLVEIESATFWKNSPEVETGELEPAEIATEVFFLPAAAHAEKDGTFTNTQRLLQWHDKAAEPQGDCQSDLSFVYHLGRRIRAKLAGSDEEKNRPILDLTWDYPTQGAKEEVEAAAVLREINGWDAEGNPLSSPTQLRDDGSTACGCWIYCGCYAEGVNQTARKKPGREQDWVAAEWAWAWPDNRRILYNRASADPGGKPWSARKAYLWWDADEGRWVGHDVPDFIADRAPDHIVARFELAFFGMRSPMLRDMRWSKTRARKPWLRKPCNRFPMKNLSGSTIRTATALPRL